MKKLMAVSVILFALFLPLLFSAPVSEQVVFSQKTNYSEFEGFAATREFSIIDRPILSQTRDVAVHDYSSIVLLTIKNTGAFERKSIYITQDFSGILSGDAKSAKKTKWDPTPSSLEWGKASHSYANLLPGEEIAISFEVSGKLTKEEFSGIPAPQINADSASAVITAPNETEVGQKVVVYLKTQSGIPIPNAEVSIISPGGKLQRIKTSKQGSIDYIAKEEGTYIYRAPGLKLIRDAQTKANPIIVSLVTSEIAPKKAEEGIFMLFNLGDFAGIIAGLVLVSVALLAVAVFLSLREKGEEPQTAQPYSQEGRERGIYSGIQTPHEGSGMQQAYSQTPRGQSPPEVSPPPAGAQAGQSSQQGAQAIQESGEDASRTKSILEERRRRLQAGSKATQEGEAQGEEGEQGTGDETSEPITIDEYSQDSEHKLTEFEDEEDEELRRLSEGLEESAEVLEEGKGDFDEGYSLSEESKGKDSEGEEKESDEGEGMESADSEEGEGREDSEDSEYAKEKGGDSGYDEEQESGDGQEREGKSREKSEFSEDELKKMENEFLRLQEQEELAREGKIVPVYEEKSKGGKKRLEKQEEETEGPQEEMPEPKSRASKFPAKGKANAKKRHAAVKKAIEKLERLTKKK